MNKHPSKAHERNEVLDIDSCLTRGRAFHNGFLISILPDTGQAEAVKVIHIEPEIPRESELMQRKIVLRCRARTKRPRFFVIDGVLPVNECLSLQMEKN